MTSRDYRVSRMAPELCVTEFMTPFDRLICASEHTTLREANDLIWAHKLNCLPIVNEEAARFSCMVAAALPSRSCRKMRR